jgi:hypothetical protein
MLNAIRLDSVKWSGGNYQGRRKALLSAPRSLLFYGSW